MKRKYELAAFDYVQRSIAPEAYKVNLYVDNGKGLRVRVSGGVSRQAAGGVGGLEAVFFFLGGCRSQCWTIYNSGYSCGVGVKLEPGEPLDLSRALREHGHI